MPTAATAAARWQRYWPGDGWPFTVVEDDGTALYNALTVALPRSMPNVVPQAPGQGERAVEVLDTTYQRGAMWQQLARRHGLRPDVHRMDIKPEYGHDTTGNFLHLDRYFVDACWDMLVWDPPMASDAGAGIAGDEDWGDRYGTDTDVPSDISVWFPSVAAGVYTLLRPGGLFFAKMADQQHGGTSLWYHMLLWQEATQRGFTLCDLYVKTRAPGMVDPKWRRRGPKHAKKNHCFYLVFRKGQC